MGERKEQTIQLPITPGEVRIFTPQVFDPMTRSMPFENHGCDMLANRRQRQKGLEPRPIADAAKSD